VAATATTTLGSPWKPEFKAHTVDREVRKAKRFAALIEPPSPATTRCHPQRRRRPIVCASVAKAQVGR
jgi:hypothetical protein